MLKTIQISYRRTRTKTKMKQKKLKKILVKQLLRHQKVTLIIKKLIEESKLKTLKGKAG